jgi:hypothetical protein
MSSFWYVVSGDEDVTGEAGIQWAGIAGTDGMMDCGEATMLGDTKASSGSMGFDGWSTKRSMVNRFWYSIRNSITR